MAPGFGLPGFVKEDGSPKYPGGYPDYIVNHERKPGIGPLAGFRGEDGETPGKGAPNKNQLDRYVANERFWRHELPHDAGLFQARQQEAISSMPFSSA